jgi:hypothetical protein
MKFSRLCIAAVAAGLSLATFSSCSNDPTLNNNGVVTFTQIDDVGRPAINMLFVPWTSHDLNDRAAPGADSSTLAGQISTFMTGAQTADRSAAIANAAALIFAPNVLVANVTVVPAAGTHGYLGIETNGVTGNLFGGRYLNDDVTTTNLSIAFGNTLTNVVPNGYPYNPVTPPSTPSPKPADDGKENNGTTGPQLTTDSVTPGPASIPGAAFPYLAPPQ